MSTFTLKRNTVADAVSISFASINATLVDLTDVADINTVSGDRFNVTSIMAREARPVYVDIPVIDEATKLDVYTPFITAVTYNQLIAATESSTLLQHVFNELYPTGSRVRANSKRWSALDVYDVCRKHCAAAGIDDATAILILTTIIMRYLKPFGIVTEGITLHTILKRDDYDDIVTIADLRQSLYQARYARAIVTIEQALDTFSIRDSGDLFLSAHLFTISSGISQFNAQLRLASHAIVIFDDMLYAVREFILNRVGDHLPEYQSVILSPIVASFASNFTIADAAIRHDAAGFSYPAVALETRLAELSTALLGLQGIKSVPLSSYISRFKVKALDNFVFSVGRAKPKATSLGSDPYITFRDAIYDQVSRNATLTQQQHILDAVGFGQKLLSATNDVSSKLGDIVANGITTARTSIAHTENSSEFFVHFSVDQVNRDHITACLNAAAGFLRLAFDATSDRYIYVCEPALSRLRSQFRIPNAFGFTGVYRNLAVIYAFMEPQQGTSRDAADYNLPTEFFKHAQLRSDVLTTRGVTREVNVTVTAGGHTSTLNVDLIPSVYDDVFVSKLRIVANPIAERGVSRFIDNLEDVLSFNVEDQAINDFVQPMMRMSAIEAIMDYVTAIPQLRIIARRVVAHVADQLPSRSITESLALTLNDRRILLSIIVSAVVAGVTMVSGSNEARRVVTAVKRLLSDRHIAAYAVTRASGLITEIQKQTL